MQIWLVALLVFMFRGSLATKINIFAGCILLTIAALPPRLWKPQLKRLLLLSVIIFTATLLCAGGSPSTSRTVHGHDIGDWSLNITAQLQL